MSDEATSNAGDQPVEQQAREQTGQAKVRVRINERNLQTAYANAFRTNGTAEDVLLDFGLNIVQPSTTPDGQPEIIFQADQRVVMNYYTAKRLALQLARIVRRHEQEFGALELDVTKRRHARK